MRRTFRNIIAALACLALTAGAGNALAQDRPITRAQLDSMFAEMKAHAPWNLDGDLLWGYFFTSPDRSQLEKAGNELSAKGYRLVEIRQVQPDHWQLHLEKVEHHTAASLDQRNKELYDLAAEYTQVTYDGMDVGPVEAAAQPTK